MTTSLLTPAFTSSSKMHLLFILVAAMAVIGAAAPSMPVNLKQATSEGSFTLLAQRKNSTYMKSPTRMVAETMKKYSRHLHRPQRTHYNVIPSTVDADPTLYDQEYLVPIHVGGQPLLIDIDTGSSDLWVFSTLLAASQQANHSLYNPAESSDSRLIPNSSWSVLYGDGSAAQGVVYTDCIWIGDTAVEQQGIEAASYVTPDFVSDTSDGILGLGFDYLNNAVPMQRTFVENAISQGLPEPVFTADLYPGAPGSYDFGFIDKSKYSGELAYSNVDSSQGFWQINVTGWSFGSGLNQTTSTTYLQSSVVDSGTSIIFFSQNVVRGYWATVPGSSYSFSEGGYIFPCGAQLPDFTVTIGAFSQTIPGSMMNYSPTVAYPTTMCFGGIQSQEGLPFNILGDVFLKNVFAVFNQSAQPTMAFAAKSP